MDTVGVLGFDHPAGNDFVRLQSPNSAGFLLWAALCLFPIIHWYPVYVYPLWQFGSILNTIAPVIMHMYDIYIYNIWYMYCMHISFRRIYIYIYLYMNSAKNIVPFTNKQFSNNHRQDEEEDEDGAPAGFCSQRLCFKIGTPFLVWNYCTYYLCIWYVLYIYLLCHSI